MSTSRQSTTTAFPARLTDAEWAVLEPLIPPNRPGGRPPKHTRRAILDAIIYVVRQGVTWRALPADFPHWNTAFWYFQEWQKGGTWGRVEVAKTLDLSEQDVANYRFAAVRKLAGAMKAAGLPTDVFPELQEPDE